MELGFVKATLRTVWKEVKTIFIARALSKIDINSLAKIEDAKRIRDLGYDQYTAFENLPSYEKEKFRKFDVKNAEEYLTQVVQIFSS